MDQITILLRKAQKYLRSAAILFEMEDFDSTASRAYFSMFYAAQALLMRYRVSVGASQGIRSAFIETFVESGMLPQRAGEALQQGYRLMEVADYAHNFGVTRTDAEAMLAEAEAFVNSVANLAEQPLARRA